MKRLISRVAIAIAKRPKIKQFVVRLTKGVGLHNRLKSILLTNELLSGQGSTAQAALPRFSEDNDWVPTAHSRRVYADLLGEVEKIRSERA